MSPSSDILGNYRLEALLGRGGTGEVFLATHIRTAERVALKTLRAPVAAFLPTIRREVAALARLQHPGIVRIVDNGLHDGLPWVAMELVEGPTLLQHVLGIGDRSCAAVETGTLPPGIESTIRHSLLESDLPPPLRSGAPDAVRPALPRVRLQAILTAVRRICAPLAYMHGEGLVHRDLKPDNILVRPGGQPVIVDFGLSVEFTSDISRDRLVVETDASGTVHYMAPEQIQGRLVDARADLYSLGCILFELLTGRPPYCGAPAARLVWDHLNATPKTPSTLMEGISPELDELVLRLLAKHPRDRLGHADDVAARLAAMGADAGWHGARARPYLYRPDLAGRDVVLGQLEGHLLPAAAGTGDTRRSLLLLSGESGVGKSRLALELGRRAERAGMLVLTAECLPAGPEGRGLPDGAGPLHPLRKSLQFIADRCRSRGIEETDRLLGRRGKLLALYEPALRGLPGQSAYPDPAELPADAARLRLFSFLDATLAALGQEAPTLLLLDDLHWADALTLDWLEHWLDGGPQPWLLVLATVRSEELGGGGGGTALRLSEKPGSVSLKLSRIDETAVGRIVSDMLAIGAPPDAFVTALARHSEGNPFFVAEYLRAAIADGTLVRSGGVWQVAQDGLDDKSDSLYASLPLPRSLRATVERRLDALSQSAQRILEAAAILGREAGETHLLKVARTEPDHAMEAFEELRVREVLEHIAAGRVRFGHDKLREVAYERIEPERRLELHRRAAEVLEAEDSENRQVDPAMLGHHWEHAGARARARECYLQAARSARSSYAHADSARHYRACIALSEGPPDQTMRLRIELGYDVLRLMNRLPEAIEELQSALHLARETGSLGAEAEVLIKLGAALWRASRRAQARECYELALHIAGHLNDDRLRAEALSEFGIVEFESGRTEEARQMFEEAAELAHVHADALTETRVLANLGRLHFEQNHFDLSKDFSERVLQLARRSGNLRNEATSLNHLGGLAWAHGQLDEAAAYHNKALALVRRLDSPRDIVLTLCNLGNIEVSARRFAEARPIFEDVLKQTRAIRFLQGEGFCLRHLAEVHANLGDAMQAQSLYEASLAVYRRAELPHFEAMLLFPWAEHERRLGRLAEAEIKLRDSERTLTRFGDRLQLAACVCGLGHLELAHGRPAREILARARELAASLRLGTQSPVDEYLGRLHRAADAFEAATPLFRGECWEDVPEALRRWLVENGHARESATEG